MNKSLKTEYKIPSKFPKRKLGMESTFDLVFSSLSFKLINEYFIGYIIRTVFDEVDKKLTDKEIKNYLVVLNTFQKTLPLNYFYWVLSETKYKTNRTNLFFQKKVYDTSDIEKIVENIIKSILESINVKKTSKNIDKLKKQIFRNIAFDKIIPFLEKNHLPPLTSQNSYKNHNIKTKLTTDVLNGNKVQEYYIFRENDIVSKIPMTHLTTGFKLKGFSQEMSVSTNIRYSLVKKQNEILKKRFKNTLKSTLEKNFNNAVFSLLVYYYKVGFVFVNGTLTIEVPQIKNKKLKKLYDDSIVLTGTPFSVPIGKKYFSLFPDIEQYFGSSGSFYNVKPVSGTYSIDIHMSNVFVKNVLEKVTKWLETSNKNLTFLLWVPLGFDEGEEKLFLEIFSNIMKTIDKLPYLVATYYYLSGKDATNETASHMVYQLSNVI